MSPSSRVLSRDTEEARRFSVPVWYVSFSTEISLSECFHLPLTLTQIIFPRCLLRSENSFVTHTNSAVDLTRVQTFVTHPYATMYFPHPPRNSRPENSLIIPPAKEFPPRQFVRLFASVPLPSAPGKCPCLFHHHPNQENVRTVQKFARKLLRWLSCADFYLKFAEHNRDRSVLFLLTWLIPSLSCYFSFCGRIFDTNRSRNAHHKIGLRPYGSLYYGSKGSMEVFRWFEMCNKWRLRWAPLLGTSPGSGLLTRRARFPHHFTVEVFFSGLPHQPLNPETAAVINTSIILLKIRLIKSVMIQDNSVLWCACSSYRPK